MQPVFSEQLLLFGLVVYTERSKEDDRAVFQAAIGGLLNATELSLVQLGEFCSEVVEAMSTSGLPIRDAVGYSLPRVGLPKDSGYFTNARTFATARGP